jgi:hypothetical protein
MAKLLRERLLARYFFPRQNGAWQKSWQIIAKSIKFLDQDTEK